MYFSFYLCVGPKLADSNIIQQIYKSRQKYTSVHNELTACYNYLQEYLGLLVQRCFKYWVIPNDNAKNKPIITELCNIIFKLNTSQTSFSTSWTR